MGELKESIGEAVAPLAEKLLPKFLEFSNWIQRNQQLVVTLGAIIGGIAVAVVAVNAAMTIWTAVTTAFTAVQAAFNAVMALNPIFLIAVAIAGIIAVLVILQKEFGLFDGVIRVVGESFAAVWGAIKTVFDWVKDNWQGLLAIITGPFILAFAAINLWKDYIIYVIAVAIGWVKDNWQGLLAIITGPFALAFGAIVFFKDSVISVFNGLKSLAATIFDGIGGAFKGVINAVISNLERGLNAAIKGLNIILDGIDSAAGPWINFGSIPEVSLPRLAEGGIVTSPTIAMIGEGGEPEAVIPLSKLGSMGVGGGGMTVNVNVTSANPNDVVAAIQKWVRNNGQLALATTSGVRF
jgi:hypothetical protein